MKNLLLLSLDQGPLFITQLQTFITYSSQELKACEVLDNSASQHDGLTLKWKIIQTRTRPEVRSNSQSKKKTKLDPTPGAPPEIRKKKTSKVEDGTFFCTEM